MKKKCSDDYEYDEQGEMKVLASAALVFGILICFIFAVFWRILESL